VESSSSSTVRDRHLPFADRATIGQHGARYGATVGIFPVDQETCATSNSPAPKEQVQLVEAYMKEQGLSIRGAPEPVYSDTLSLDLSSRAGLAAAAAAGPSSLRDLPRNFISRSRRWSSPRRPSRGRELGPLEARAATHDRRGSAGRRRRPIVDLQLDGGTASCGHGSS